MDKQPEFSNRGYRLNSLIWLFVFMLVLLLNGCKLLNNGGSGGGEPRSVDEIPVPAVNQPPSARFTASPVVGEAPLNVSFDASASSDDGSITAYAWDFGDGNSASGEAVSHIYTTTGTYTVTLTVTDDDGDSNTQSRTINVTATASLPPDPIITAPSIDTTKPASVFNATAFLYTGSNPLQTGVAEETIVEHRAAVLRGRVMDRGGQPLPGVTVTILDHPKLGQTLTRENGLFDLAVNGGGHLTVNYHKTGYLVAQRRIKAPWNDYAWLPDVALVALAPESSTLDPASSDPVQVVQGPEISDKRGTRRTTLLVPRGINAQMLMSDGSTHNFSSNTLTVRATEFTVGENGPEAMPGELPPGMAYTYAVELSVDEAEAAGAASVQFDRPLYQYVENFVGFSVGDTAPHYYYNRLTGNWEDAEAGVVIKLLDTSTGMASIDSDGDDVAEDAATLSMLGFTDDERSTLASLYSAGVTLWRVPVTHFSPHDINWYQRQLDGQVNLGEVEIEAPTPVWDPCNSSGSVIECQNQVLGERVPVVGTPFTLNYRSSRMPGYKVDQELRIRLLQSVPGNLAGIRVRITTAGQLTEVYYTAQQLRAMADYSYRYLWDGRDAYGRTVQGDVTARISLGYDFNIPYQTLRRCENNNCWVEYSRTTLQTFFVYRNVSIKPLATPYQTDGGWTLSVNHSYSSKSQILHKGNGRNQSALPIGALAAGSYAYLSARFDDRCKDGERAIGGCHLPTTDVAVAADGSLIIMDEGGGGESLEGVRIRKVDPQGIVSTVLTSGDPYDPQVGDVVFYPSSVAVGHDNSIYVGECGRVLRITANGEVSVFVGTNTSGFSGDGGPATAAQIGCADDIAVGPDGSLYIADNANDRVRRVNPQGIISTVAGGGNIDSHADDIPATDLDSLGTSITALAVAEDGSLYLGMYDRIRKIDPTGIIRTIAGNGTNTVSGDGGPALEAGLGELQGLAIGGDGNLYVSSIDWSTGPERIAYLRKISPAGIINELPATSVLDIPGDNIGQASSVAGGIEVGPDGGLYAAVQGDFMSGNSGGVYRFRTAGPSRDYRLIASDSGDEIYRFEQGLHRATLSARTGAELYRFGYDDARHLVSITDGSGNITRIERDSDGMLSAIVAPGGQRTTVSTDDNDFLASISNPQGETWAFGYSEDGLLLQSTDPNKGVSTYIYNDSGQLIENENPAGGGNTLTRTMVDSGVLVTRTSAEGVVYSYNTRSSGDSVLYTNQGCCGASSTTITADGVSHFTLNDGSSATSINDADARRFGNQAPYLASLRLETPAGRSYEMQKTVSSTLEDWSDPLSMTQHTETILLPASATSWSSFTRVYDTATGEEMQTTAEGRQSVITYDKPGRVVMYQTGSLASQILAYDSVGRMTSITTGSGSEARGYALTYRDDNTLASVSDASGSVMQFTQDGAGRVTGMDLPGGLSVGFAYNAKGNLTELTTPEGTTHSMGYSATGQMTSYTPPAVTGTGATFYAYDLDSRLSRISRPDGIDMDFAYDGNGRLSSIAVGNGSITLDQDSDSDHLNAITAIDGGTLSFVYDGPLLIASQWAGDINGQITFDYGPRFELVSSTVNGTTLNYGYDQDGLLISSGALSITRDISNGFVDTTRLDNITDARSYNGFGEIASYTASNSSSDVYSASYSRDTLGRIVQKVETIAGVSHIYDYSYNIAGWLIEVQTDGVTTESYDYDLNGNRTNLANSAATGGAIASFDAQDRMLSQGSTSYQYSPAGELESSTTAGKTTSYNYDVFGNLLNVSLSDGRNIEYLVDGMNRRIGRKVNGTLSHGWLYKDKLNPVAELDASGNVVSRFVYGSKPNVPDYMIKAGTTYRIISDHLGSVRLVVNAGDGSIAQRINYDAWGRVLNDTSPGFQPFGFAGGLYDPDTGLVRFGARDFNPDAGRWTAKDPRLFSGANVNLYAYGENNPVTLIDQTGRISGLPVPTSLVDAAVLVAQSIINSGQGAQAVGEDAAGVAIDTIGVAGGLITGGVTAAALGVTGTVGVVVGSFNVGVGIGNTIMGTISYVTGYDPTNLLSDLLLPDDDLTALINADAVLCP